MSFVPCPSCRRHVRAGDAACPFCGAAGAAEPAVAPSASVPGQRLSRGAMFAFAVSVAACSSSGDDGNPGLMYGGPPIDASTLDTGAADGGLDSGNPAPAYGAPADTGTPDASKPDTGNADTGGASDVGADTSDTGGPAPLYGLPPPSDAG
jgi:hypothetical protein